MSANENITVVLKAGTKVMRENGSEEIWPVDTVVEVFAMDEKWHIYLWGTSEMLYVKAEEDK